MCRTSRQVQPVPHNPIHDQDVAEEPHHAHHWVKGSDRHGHNYWSMVSGDPLAWDTEAAVGRGREGEVLCGIVEEDVWVQSGSG